MNDALNRLGSLQASEILLVFNNSKYRAEFGTSKMHFSPVVASAAVVLLFVRC